MVNALLCDGCHRPLGGEGFDVTLLRGIVVAAPGETTRLTTSGSGAMAATLCERCGERLRAILRRKLHAPCPTCELEPMRQADRRLDGTAGAERRAG